MKKNSFMGGYSHGSHNFAIVESYKSLRTNLQFALSVYEHKLLVVTSAEAAAGKSTTIANVAVALAQAESKVLLIDADMRQPTQHKIFKRPNEKGLSNVLSGFCSLEDALHVGVMPGLDLLPAGIIPPNPSELLVSKRMSTLIDCVKDKYDYVFLDAPPICVVSDAMTLLDRVPNTLLVARQKQTTYDAFQTAEELVVQNGGTVVGTVITDVRERDRLYGAGYRRKGNFYYYSYYGARRQSQHDSK